MMETSDDQHDMSDELPAALQRYQDLVQAGRCADAEEAIEEIMDLVMQHAETDNSPDWALVVAASDCELAHDYAGMEQAQLKRLAIADAHNVTGIHRDLARLYVALNRHGEALVHAEAIAAIGRRSDFPFGAALELRLAGGIHLRLGHVAQAEEYYRAALDRLDVDDASCNQIRASLLSLLAACDLACDRTRQASERLDAAIELLCPYTPMLSAAGVQSDLAEWWVNTAWLRVKLGEVDEAGEAWQEAVTLSRLVVELPQCEGIYAPLHLARVLHEYAQASTFVGGRELAARLSAESASIAADLGLPPQRYY